MSNNIKTKLVEVYNELEGAKSNIAKSKKGIADALRFNGITNIGDTETFARYAEIIRRLKSMNSMTFEFQIPESAATTYKKTIVLPMYFGTKGNEGASINSIAKELISSEPATMSLNISDENTTEDETNEYAEHLIKDVYGNTIMDGNFTIPMSDIDNYLSEEQSEEFKEAAVNLGLNVSDYGISTMSLDKDGNFEPSTTAMYSYTVDWGDKTELCIFDETKTYEENKAAIWHTYSKGGTYDVTINGTYKKIYTQGQNEANFVENGAYVCDTDKEKLINNNNYGMRNYLISVIAWGNTLLTEMSNAFMGCKNLKEIPMYDTTNSFENVWTFYYAFGYCSSLKSLPFNKNTSKGLFSGCKKALNFQYTFYSCDGLTEPIPDKIVDGCTNVTSIDGMFGQCTKITGSIPKGMFAGMTSLKSASDVFSSCSQMNGKISTDLFKDCPNIESIARLFFGCTNITGTLEKDFIGGLSKLTNMRQAFYNCKGITGFDKDAFYKIKSDNINCCDAFYGSGITEIPEGLIESMTGKNLRMERMFGNCTSLKTIPSSCLSALKVHNARGIFGGCTALSSPLPTANDDWGTYDCIQRWYGAFAKTSLSDIVSVCAELGGDGERKFSEGSVGKIVLADKKTSTKVKEAFGEYNVGDTISDEDYGKLTDEDKKKCETAEENIHTMVEIKDYEYNSSKPPIGVVYADVYIDPTVSTPMIANSVGNVVTKETEGAVHKIYAAALNDTYLYWTNGQNNAEDITTIMNTSDVEVGYNGYKWNDDKTKATRNPTRYNGEAYSKAINEWRVAKGMATYDEENGYIKTDIDKYDAIDYVNMYNLATNSPDKKVTNKCCFLPDGADLWDEFTQKYLIQKACDKIIAGGGGFSTSNCMSMRDSTVSWASAETSASGAWGCNTYNSYLGNWNGKWNNNYVRPSFAIEA